MPHTESDRCCAERVWLARLIQDRPYTCHSQHSNYITATHNITHPPCTSTCTPHPALPIPLPSTTLLWTQLTNTKHSWQNGTRCRDGVKLLWCHSHLVWLVFEGSIPTCTCFHSENFFVTFGLDTSLLTHSIRHCVSASQVEEYSLCYSHWWF